MLRYLETGTRAWIVVAGFCGGLAVLAKITGLYVLGSALLSVTFVASSVTPGTSSEEDGASAEEGRVFRPGRAGVTAGWVVRPGHASPVTRIAFSIVPLLIGAALTAVVAIYVEWWLACAMPPIILFLVGYFAYLRYGADGVARTDLDGSRRSDDVPF